MSLADRFLETRQAEQAQRLERGRPKTWRAGTVEIDGQTTVTSRAYTDTQSPEHEQLLKDHGFNPERFRIVGPIRTSRWDAYRPKEARVLSTDEDGKDGFMVKAVAFRFAVAERPVGAPSVDELIAAIDRHQPTAPKVTATALDPDAAYVIALGDLQIAKLENPTEELLGRIIDLIDRACAPLNGHGHVHIAWLGDCIEGNVSQGGKNRWRTTLTMTEQVRILRRIMLAVIERVAPHAERVTVVAVAGNHDEAAPRDLATRIDDSWALEALNSVADALLYAPDRFGHVECYVPGKDEQGVVTDVAGTRIAHVHGHTIRPGQHFKWWAGQAFGRQDIGEADLLLQGHIHHMALEEDGKRKWLAAPALEAESVWWKHATGTGGAPGLLTFQTRNGSITNLTKHEPKGS